MRTDLLIGNYLIFYMTFWMMSDLYDGHPTREVIDIVSNFVLNLTGIQAFF